MYQEGINTVSTIRDFQTIFEAYSAFLENVINARMETAEKKALEQPSAADDDGDEEMTAADAGESKQAKAKPKSQGTRKERRKAEQTAKALATAAAEKAKKSKSSSSAAAESDEDPDVAQLRAELEAEEKDDEAAGAEDVDIDLRLLRLDTLMEQRPLLVSSVLLRQNPHNVTVSHASGRSSENVRQEWLNRVKLFKDDVLKQVRMLPPFSCCLRALPPCVHTKRRVLVDRMLQSGRECSGPGQGDRAT